MKKLCTMNIGEHFLPALINGDYSGLSDEDEAILKKHTDERKGLGTIYEPAWGDTTEFGICDISGLRDNTIRVTLYSFR